MIERRILSSYLGAGEVFHLARRTLAPRGKGRAAMAPHNHDYHELFWVESGRLLHRANGLDLMMEPGSLAFIRPDDVHALLPRGGPSNIVNLSLPSQTCDHLLARYGAVLSGQTFWIDGVAPHTVSLGAEQWRVLNAWANRLEVSGRGQLVLDAFLLAVLGILNRPDPLPEGAQDGPAWLAESCRALLQGDVLRQGVAGFTGVSGLAPEHVARVTRKFTGKTPSQLVAQIRMATAARLLANSGVPIAQIALDVGLANLSHFYVQFKAHHGTTPRRYRQQNSGDPVLGG